MKLHLPKQLFTALLTAITLAASPVAKGAVNYNELGIVREDNCYAHDYTFSFILNEDAFSGVTADAAGNSTIVLASYWGSNSNNPDSNAIVLIRNRAGDITLKIGRGEVGSYADLKADSTFAFHNENTSHITLSTNLEVGTVYTLYVTGGDQAMDPTLYSIAAGSTSDNVDPYKGNMNGNDDLDSVFNHEVATLVSKNVTNTSSGTATLEKTNTLVWAGAADGDATSANWGAWKNISRTPNDDISGTSNGATADATSDLIFDATSTVAKEVNITDSVTVGSISVYYNYTFNATTATTLTTTSGLTIASGKELTLQGADITLSGTIANNGTLALENKLTLETTAERALGKVALMNGSTLEIFNKDGGRVVNISDLSITGSATVATTKSSSCHQGTINISDLTGAGATLVLSNGSQTGKNTLFNLGDSNAETSFSGTIRLQGAADTGAARRTSLNINDADVAKGAVIEFYNDSSNNSALGIGVSKVEIAGLQDVNADGTVNANGTSNVTIYGYKIGGGSDNFHRDSTDTDQQARTLEITGAGTYATKAAINGGLNIIMNNADGSQTFKGSANLGTVTVKAGSLTFSEATTLGGDVDNAGTLTFSGAVTIASGAEISITSADDLVTTFSNTLSGGKLTVSAGTVSYTREADKGYKVLNTVISSGATLEMKQGDSIDYSDTPGMTMTVEGTLDFGEGRQTLGSNFSLELKDGAVVTGGDGHGGLDFNGAGGSITSNGAASIQNGAIRLRNEDVKIDVQSGTLTTGTIVHSAASATADIIKDGEGTLKITSMAQGGVHNSYQEVFFDGATTLKAGTVEYALTADGTYNGTITGTGNIKNSGSAAVTLANIQNLTGTIQVDAGTLNITTLTNLQGSLEVNAGKLNITTLNALKTITVNIEDGATLSLGTVKVNPDTQSLNQISDTSFYTIDGEKESTNGYLMQTGTYVLFDGYQWKDGSVSGYKLSTDAEKNQTTLSVTGAKGETFFVNGEFSSSDITGAAIATKYHVNANGEFTIAGDVTGGKTAAELLSSTTGTGTMILDTDVTVSGSDNNIIFDGTLKLDGSELADDTYRTLNVGSDDEGTNAIASLKEVVLEGQSKIQYHTNPVSETDIQKLTVAENGKGQLYFEDTNGAAMVIGELQLKSGSGFTLGGNWQDSAITIGKLSGSGSFTYESPSHSRQQVTIDSLLGFTGDMVLDNSSADGGYSVVINTGTTGAVDFSSLTAKGSGTVLNVQSNTTVDTIDAGSGVVNFSAGTMLTLGGDTTSTSTIGTVTANAAGNTIHLNSTATLGRLATVNGGTITLTGSGTYDLGSNTSTNVSGLDAEAWTGTVRISSATTSAGVDLNSFGNSRSYLELSGVAKWLSGSGVTTNVNLILKKHETESYGFKMTGTNAGATYRYNGSISGDGDLVIGNGNEYSGQRTFTFAGDLSEWEGRLVLGLSYGANKNNPTVNLTYAGSADAAPTFFSGDDSGIRVDENHAGTLTVNIGNATRTAVMNGSITNVNTNDNGEEVVQGSIDLNVVGDTNFNKDVVVTKMVVNAGKTATLTGNANSLKAGDATITSKSETDAALSNVTVQAGSISAASTATGAKGSISNADVQIAQLAQDATFTIEDMTLTNTTITAATVETETRVNLSNVSASNLALAQGKFTMNAAPVVGLGGTEATFNTGVSSLTAGAATLTLDLDMIGAYESTGAVSGATLTITLGVSGANFSSYTVENWQALVGFDQESWLGQALVDATFTTEAVAASAEAGSAAPTVSYGYAAGGSNVGMLTITITGLNVPEPTTATLSLLALAALAARRRRQA